MMKLDPRLHAVRPDLADVALEGSVTAERFVIPQIRQIADPLVSVRNAPRPESMQTTQALMGETVKLFHEQDGWAWIQLMRDSYVGYVRSSTLREERATPTHRVAVPSTLIYPEPSLKSQPAIPVTLNAQVSVTGENGVFSSLADGRFIFSGHLRPAGQVESDFVATAEMYQHVPYYWGGKSAHGLDCSGLVQLALEASGRQAPRDSDMQEMLLGEWLERDGVESLQRGDLVFWKGHVGIMTDASTLLHANGFHMMVVSEPLSQAKERIATSYGAITSIKRL